MLLPIRTHPNGVPVRRPAPRTRYPHPSATVQVPKSVRPHKARSGRVAHRSDSHWRGRRRNLMCNVCLRGARSQRGGCKHHTSENSLFHIHEKASYIRLDWRAVLTGFAYEREVILRSIHRRVLRRANSRSFAATKLLRDGNLHGRAARRLIRNTGHSTAHRDLGSGAR